MARSWVWYANVYKIYVIALYAALDNPLVKFPKCKIILIFDQISSSYFCKFPCNGSSCGDCIFWITFSELVYYFAIIDTLWYLHIPKWHGGVSGWFLARISCNVDQTYLCSDILTSFHYIINICPNNRPPQINKLTIWFGWSWHLLIQVHFKSENNL